MGTNILSDTLEKFSPISLTELNSQASFLDRVETKYIIDELTLSDVLKELEKDFFVLSINWKTVQEYSSIYMDTDDYYFYNQHNKGEKVRTKIRTREYVDSKIAFFEYKQKDKKLTRKFRFQSNLENHWEMTPESEKFVEGIYMSMYWESPMKITPALETRYNRLTLCSKDSSERLTVDFNVRVKNLRKEDWWDHFKMENTVIIESKSSWNSEKSRQVMEKLW